MKNVSAGYACEIQIKEDVSIWTTFVGREDLLIGSRSKHIDIVLGVRCDLSTPPLRVLAQARTTIVKIKSSQ